MELRAFCGILRLLQVHAAPSLMPRGQCFFCISNGKPWAAKSKGAGRVELRRGANGNGESPSQLHRFNTITRYGKVKCPIYSEGH